MKLTLYYAPITCALVPYITLTEAGADFDVRPVNLRNGEHRSPEYLKLNPKHQVPMLVIDGEPLTENPAIQVWIARNFPKAKLLPEDSMLYVKAISILSFCASGIHPFLFRINSPQLVCDLPRNSYSKNSRWRKRCWRVANGSSTISPPPMLISSGASGAAHFSPSTNRNSGTARHTSSE
jgi:glutathione S-transferase